MESDQNPGFENWQISTVNKDPIRFVFFKKVLNETFISIDTVQNEDFYEILLCYTAYESNLWSKIRKIQVKNIN